MTTTEINDKITSAIAPAKTPLINRSHVKKLALHCATLRARKFTRVSNDFLVAINACVTNCVATRVANHPSLGTTLK